MESRGLLNLGRPFCFSRFIDSSSGGDDEEEIYDSTSSRSRRSSIRGSLTFLLRDVGMQEDWGEGGCYGKDIVTVMA